MIQKYYMIYIVADAPVLVDAYQYDTCNVLLQIEWQGACVIAPPDNDECVFSKGFQSMNLSTIKGSTLTYTDSNELAWRFSPCSNKLNCTTSHGTDLEVMSQVNDPTGQCIKFLGVWSGDVVPFYERNIFGEPYWSFYWCVIIYILLFMLNEMKCFHLSQG